MRRGFEEIHQLAKTAAKWDLGSDEGYEEFRLALPEMASSRMRASLENPVDITEFS